MMKVTTLACLFVSADGKLAIHLLEPPLPPEYHLATAVPPGMTHATRALGLAPEVRTFKRTAGGPLAMYEEVQQVD
jgi:hypothetical protein